MFMDTHCHLDDELLLSRLPEVLAAARAVGVTEIVVPAVAPEGWERISCLAQGGRGIYPAYGLHPLFAARCDDRLLADLSRYIEGAVAIGEIGLDYAVSEVPRAVQQAAFREQLRLARRFEKPVIIHCRRAFGDLLRIVREERAGDAGGIMHAFSGSMEMAAECLRAGFHISLAGPVTYRNAVKPLEVAARLPVERLVLETDAPDLTPEPYRGRANEPAYLVAIARRIAAIRGIAVEDLAAATTANAGQLLNIR